MSENIIIRGFDYIGYNGPILVFLMTFYYLWEQPFYLVVFVITSVANYFLNGVLKKWIREPRPKNPVSYVDDELITGANTYGMPSGHSQLLFFSAVYLYLVRGSTLLLWGSLFIGGLTVYQRWKFRRHTVAQLFAGSLVGGTFAWMVYNSATFYLQSYTKRRIL